MQFYVPLLLLIFIIIRFIFLIVEAQPGLNARRRNLPCRRKAPVRPGGARPRKQILGVVCCSIGGEGGSGGDVMLCFSPFLERGVCFLGGSCFGLTVRASVSGFGFRVRALSVSI